MQTLIVPDIHENLSRLYNIEETLMPQADHVVMLGDFWDTFGERRSKDTAIWVRDHILDPKFTILLGNHCAHYAFKHSYFKCSGYNAGTQRAINEILDTEHWRGFKLRTKVGKFLLSHAGFTENTLRQADLEEDRALDIAFEGGFHSLFNAGQARGGRGAVGGPTWLDWNYEFEPLEQAQIVGHTLDKTVRTRVHEPSGAVSYCLDTALRHAVWVDTETNEVEIVTL